MALHQTDLFPGGDEQVFAAGIEQQVLVDLVSGAFSELLLVPLGGRRQMNLQHLKKHSIAIKTLSGSPYRLSVLEV